MRYVLPFGKGGCVAPLTPTQIAEIFSLPDERIGSLCVFDALDCEAALRATKLGFLALCGFSNTINELVITIRDSFRGNIPPCPSTDAGVFGETEGGRRVLTVDLWKTVIQLCQPTCVVLLHEALPLAEQLGKKRLRAAQTRAERWFDSTKDITGVTKYCAVGVSANDPVVISNVNTGEDLNCRRAFIESVLTQNRDCLVHAESLAAMIMSVRCGATLIESSFPIEMARKGVAVNISLTTGVTVFDLHDPKFQLLNLHLCELSGQKCRCETCRHHSAAYVHHLISVQEMNAEILLCVHNLTQICDMFRALRGKGAAELDQFLHLLRLIR